MLIIAFASLTTISAKAAGKTKENKATKTTAKKQKKSASICSFDFWGATFDSNCGRYVTVHVTVMYWCDSGVIAMPTRVTTASCESSATDFNFA